MYRELDYTILFHKIESSKHWSFRSVVVITCASHAQGRRFEPGRKHNVLTMKKLSVLKVASQHLREFGCNTREPMDVSNSRYGFDPLQGEGLCKNLRHEVEFGQDVVRPHVRSVTTCKNCDQLSFMWPPDIDVTSWRNCDHMQKVWPYHGHLDIMDKVSDLHNQKATKMWRYRHVTNAVNNNRNR